MDNYLIPDWMLQNFNSWLVELSEGNLYRLKSVALDISDLRDDYADMLADVCKTGSANNKQIISLYKLVGLMCEMVNHMHYPACDIAAPVLVQGAALLPFVDARVQ